MKNVWLDEVQVRDLARKISHSLVFAFVGTKTDMNDWGRLSFDMMRDVECRIRDSLMWKYTFKSEVDEHGIVQFLEFVKLPWLV